MRRFAARFAIWTTVLAAVLLCGCASEQVPSMSQPHAAVLGIDVTLRAALGDTLNKPVVVYLAKVDTNGGLLQQQIVRTNYVKDGRAYLLNAAPGTYVAVAAYSSPPMLVTTTDSITYLSKQLVEQSKTTVGEGEFAFMGSFEVAQAVWLDQADEVQKHYRNLLSPSGARGIVGLSLNQVTSYLGSAGASKDEERARNGFVQSARKDFAGSAWAALLR